MEKYGTAKQVTDDNMLGVLCLLDNWGYRHTLGIYNTHSSSRATMVTWMLCNVTFICTFPVF